MNQVKEQDWVVAKEENREEFVKTRSGKQANRLIARQYELA
jgi:hypothetical protein